MRNFLPVPFAPYNGQVTSKPFNDLGGIKRLSVVAQVKWATYSLAGASLGAANPQFNVVFDLNAAASNLVSQTWMVNSIYVDNTGVAFPVYVYFPDTDYAVTCPANTAGWFRAFTVSRRAWIVGLGIDNVSIQNGAQTNVFFTDAMSVPYVDAENATAVQMGLASPLIAFGGSGGQLANVLAFNSGSNYSAGTLSINGAGGIGAAVTGGIDQFGRFTGSFAINNAGAGYTGPPNITATAAQNLRANWIAGAYPVGSIVIDPFDNQFYTATSNVAVPNTGFAPHTAPSLWQASGIQANRTAQFTSSVTPIVGGNSIVNNSNYGARALGDQAVTLLNTISQVGVFAQNLWGTPYASGYIYITNLYVFVTNNGDATWQLEDNNGDFFLEFQPGNTQGTILELQGVNLKLPATSNWRLNCTRHVTNPVVLTTFAYTYSQF